MANPAPKPTGNVKATLQIVLIILVVLLGVYIFYKYVQPFLYWIIAIISLLLVLFNWRSVLWFVRKIRDVYKKDNTLGIVATILAILFAPVVVIFLAAKTIYEFAKKQGGKDTQPATVDADYEELDSEKKNRG